MKLEDAKYVLLQDASTFKGEAFWYVQVLHDRRILYNCRNGWDIARFLADATSEDVEAHLFNLKYALAHMLPIWELPAVLQTILLLYPVRRGGVPTKIKVQTLCLVASVYWHT